ncbi:MAG: hypothetical protein AB7O88_09525 [Reyranellaceae bacterium]
MSIQPRIAARIVAIGTFASVSAVSVIGLHQWYASHQCKAAWEQAGERTGDHLTDRAATPYLAMMLASKHEVPADYRVARHDFVSACRTGAIRHVVLRDDAGIYVEAAPIGGGQPTSLR